MNIYLIGMMGSGKSTVGKILAKKMGLPIYHFIAISIVVIFHWLMSIYVYDDLFEIV